MTNDEREAFDRLIAIAKDAMTAWYKIIKQCSTSTYIIGVRNDK